MKKIVTGIICFLLFFTLVAPLSFAQETSTVYEGTVTQVKGNSNVTVQIATGPHKGKSFQINTNTAQTVQKVQYSKGDEVIVSFSKGPGGKDAVYVVDFVRNKQLLLLLFLFAAAVFYIGRWKGLTSFVGMIFSFMIIGNFIIPQILLGNDPVLITLIGALFMTPIIFYLGHGINKKTTVALIGTFLSLIVTGLLAYLFVFFSHLTGFSAEEASYLQLIKGGAVNIRSLLLAGIIIGALGVLDDTTISQAALVEKLKETNKNFHTKELYKHSMEVGRDHIASLVNTLVLVYTGAALPLFLLFYSSRQSFTTVVNQEVIATEIVRTLVASIGIILAVPLTTFIACLFYKD